MKKTEFLEEKYRLLKEHFDSVGGNGYEVVSAVKDLYTLYDEGLLSWLAGLYEPSVGGFYYSRSARDNDGFLPDIESTLQALNIIENGGMIGSLGELPEKMKGQIREFVCSLQCEEDGYIYHPQWGKNITDSRKGRDINWAIDLSRRLDFKLPYPTPSERLKAKKESGNSKTASVGIPEHLLSEEAMKNYLDGFDWINDSYYAGNTIAAQSSQIISAGLAAFCAEYINKFQNPENGFWHKETNIHYGVNGFLKITAFYNQAKLPIPYAERAAESTIACLVSDEVGTTPCHLFNCWFNLMNIADSLRLSGGKYELSALESISKKLIETAPITIRGSKAKQSIFKKEDGGFSYTVNYSCAASQGAPAAVPNTRESDVNATVLCSSGSVGRMFMGLGAGKVKVPIFTPYDKDAFFSSLRLN